MIRDSEKAEMHSSGLSSAGRQAEARVSEAAHAVPRLGRAMRDAQVGGEVAGPGKLLGAQVAGVLDPEGPVHLHVPVEAAARRKRPVARAAEGTRGPSSSAAAARAREGHTRTQCQQCSDQLPLILTAPKVMSIT